MARFERNGASRSTTIYGLLLELYPRAYLQQHRAEMLQNFQDLEQASPSKARLWLSLARDLVLSLRSQFMKTLWGQTLIVILVLVSLLVHGRHVVAHERLIDNFCFGYILGWFAGWFGRQWQASVGHIPTYIRSLQTQAMVIVGIAGLVIAAWKLASSPQSHLIWIFCYGFLLAWFAGWIGNRPQNRSSAGGGR